MNSTFFVTGISTGVGKTVVSAIIAQALKGDYWKPVQAGDLENSDSRSISDLVDFPITIHPSAYSLLHPMSPHAAAELEGIEIDMSRFIRPKTGQPLVIEGAGGILVPLSDTHTIIDLIRPEDRIVVVSRHYLGSINHTLLTLNSLKQRGFSKISLIFNGAENVATERIILEMSGVQAIGRLEEEPFFDRRTIGRYAQLFRGKLFQVIEKE